MVYGGGWLRGGLRGKFVTMKFELRGEEVSTRLMRIQRRGRVGAERQFKDLLRSEAAV